MPSVHLSDDDDVLQLDDSNEVNAGNDDVWDRYLLITSFVLE